MAHPPTDSDLGNYSGRWVAILRGRVVGQGGTPDLVRQAAKINRYKETPEVVYVPTANPLVFSPVFEKVCLALPQDISVYLVGGAIRDAILSRPIQDYDFVLAGNGLLCARGVADHLNGAYYPLDQERKIGRVIFKDEQGERNVLDFASLQVASLEDDLRKRDFTINAMAVDIRKPQELLDPYGGIGDLWNKILRVPSSTSLTDDPVRIVRAVRIAAKLDLKIHPQTRKLMHEAVSLLENVSVERLRDELFQIFDGPRPDTSIRALEILGVLPYILPELLELKDIPQSPPHINNVWDHTLNTLKNVRILLDLLSERHGTEDSLGLIRGLGVVRLGRYRRQIKEHFQAVIIPERNLRSLLCLTALYHDVGKSRTKRVSEDGRIRFFNHDQIGADIISKRGEDLRLSNREINHLSSIVKHHMRPTHLAREKKAPSARAIYRFFRDTQATGIDICLLSLADLLATYGTTLPQERWARQLDIVRVLMDAWWECHGEQVQPPVLVSGNDLIAQFGLESGPKIGEFLEMIREAQVSGDVETQEDAINLIRGILQNDS